MSWLTTFLASVVALLLEKLGVDFSSFLKKKQEQKQSQDETASAEAESIKPLQSALNGKEIKDAARSAFDKT